MRQGVRSFLVLGFFIIFCFRSWALEEEPLRAYLMKFGTLPRWVCEVVAMYPHDSGAFTQGLILEEETLIESTGLYGESSLRKVELATGEILQRVDLSPEYFAEGLTAYGDKLIQLTWKSHKAFLYDRGSLRKIAELPYPYEGWGITFDGENLIVSDGSATLRFLDPENFQEKRKVTVHVQEREIVHLNELEYIEDKIYANVWHEDVILIICPQTGKVCGWIDCVSLQDANKKYENVLNGIAYDSRNGTLLVTGKRWCNVYRIRMQHEVPAF